MLSVKNYIRTFVRKPSWFVHLVDCDYAHRQPSQVHSARDYFSTCAQKKMGARRAPIYVLALSAPALFRIHPVDPTLSLADLHFIA